MNILAIIIGLFVLLETSNIIMLYFLPETKKGNGVGVFNAYESSKAYPEIHRLVKYLINWVAGTKLIFIMLLIIIIFFGSETVRLYSVIALIISIMSFYWRLYPMIKDMDSKGEVSPKGYSKTLFFMITAFILVFLLAVIIHLL